MPPLNTRPPVQVGGTTDTPQLAQVQEGLTVPSAQTILPLAEHEVDMPPWLEQQPGQAENAAVAAQRPISDKATHTNQRTDELGGIWRTPLD